MGKTNNQTEKIPMKVKCLGSLPKDQICLAYQRKTLTIGEMAKYFNTSSRTIGRVLEERGLATPVPRLKGEAYMVMKLLEERGIAPENLEAVLNAPKVIRASDVQSFLNTSSKEALATFFYTSGLVKLAQANQQVHSNVQATQSTSHASH